MSSTKDPKPDERRREHRIRIEEAVLISLLGPLAGPPIPGAVIDVSGSGLKILSPRPLPCGAQVKIQGLNRLMVGEVLRSEPEGDSFAIGFKVNHVLNQLSDLEALHRQPSGERTER
jgi:hypothetical protein